MALDEPPRLSGCRTAFRAAFTEQARKLALRGANNAQLADFFGVDEHTLEHWIERYPAFSQALEEARALADSRAVKSRELDKALDTALACERRTAEQAGPFGLDPTVSILWLKSHRPSLSADAAGKLPRGKDGNPIKPEDQRDKLSDLELARRVAFILARADPAIQDTWASGRPGTGAMAAPSTGRT